MLVSVDVYRPAAREQLQVVAKAIRRAHLRGQRRRGVNTAAVERLAKEARKEAVNSGCDVLIVDTAGRLHIDEQLMEEMQSLKRLLNPQEILFVADAMTGQDAVNSAEEFHEKLTLTGVVLTKMDGDARGGAALSIRSVTGAAHQVHRRGRKIRRPGALPSRPHRGPHPGHGRHPVAHRAGRGEARQEEVRGVRQQGAQRRRLLAGGLPRPAAAGEEAGLAGQSIVGMLP